MSQPQFLISYKDLDLRPCSPYKGLPKRGKFDVIAQIIRVRGYLYAPDLAWAIRHCPKLQTPEMLSHFIASRPTAHEIVLIMRDCGEFARTPEMLSHFLAAKPSGRDIFDVICGCDDFARTPKMLRLFLESNSPAYPIGSIMINFDFARTPEVLAAFIAAKPTAEEISCVIRKCGDFAQTPELLAAFLAAKPTVHQVIKIRKECEYARTPELRSLCCIRCSDPKTWRAHVCHC